MNCIHSYEAEWDGDKMLVLGCVEVHPPYKPSNVHGRAKATTALVQRIMKVVEGNRAREGLGAAVDAAMAH